MPFQVYVAVTCGHYAVEHEIADVSIAFLQGHSQDRKVWIKFPSEALALLGADEDTRMLLLKICCG